LHASPAHANRNSVTLKPVDRGRLTPCIHHWGIEVEDRDSYLAKIKTNGGTIISELGEGALKFRAPDGTVAEIVGAGRYKTRVEKQLA
jgi:hypothetical protein